MQSVPEHVAMIQKELDSTKNTASAQSERSLKNQETAEEIDGSATASKIIEGEASALDLEVSQKDSFDKSPGPAPSYV